MCDQTFCVKMPKFWWGGGEGGGEGGGFWEFRTLSKNGFTLYVYYVDLRNQLLLHNKDFVGVTHRLSPIIIICLHAGLIILYTAFLTH